MDKNVLKTKKYIAALLLVLVIGTVIGVLKIGNFDKLAGKVKVKDAHLSNISTKLSSNVFDATSDSPVTSNGIDQINYELKYKVSNADRDVIITGTLNDDERYATFKRITGQNITSTLSNNDRSIEIVISNVPANTEITTNVLLLINGAPNGYTVNPTFKIKESTSESFTDIYTNPINVSTNDLRGVVRNTDSESIGNIIVSLYKNRELVKETYTNANGEYIFSDLNEDSYTVKINEEIYKDVNLSIDVNGDTVLDIETERIYPFKLQIHKYITKVDAYNVGNLISRSYSNATTVNFPVEKLQSLSGKVYYKIVVENTGEKEGVVSAVKDELPKFMSFDESENSGFELKNGYIYDRNLEGITLAPGESREDSLVLNIVDTKEARTYLNKVNAQGEIYEHVVYLLDGQTYKEEDVLEGELTTRPSDPNPNFEGWYTDSKYTNKYNFNNPVIKNLILYGKTEQKYRVDFYDKNPETGEETPYDTQEVNGGETVTKPTPDPEHTGYTFEHWCKTDLTEYIFGTPVNENLKLITCYKINEYDINFYNYEDTKEKTIQVEYKHLIDETLAPSFDETGYTFLCWTKDKTNCYDFTTPVTENVDLYPTHEKLKNAVVFNDENRITTKEVPYGDTVEPVDNQGKTGHTFRCWSEDRENCFDFNTPIIQNTTVYAVYDINKYTVHFIDRDPEYGTEVQYGEDQIIDYGNTATKPTPDPEHTGYTFSEWKNGDETYNFETPVTSDLILISSYSINTYPVRFHNDNEVTTVNVEYKHKVTPIESPTKEHHIFTAWLDVNDLPFDFDNTLIVDATDLYSSFEEVLSPNISHNPTMWTNENVTVTVSKNENLDDDTGYSYLYKTTEGTYNTYETPFTISENTTIIAKAVKSDVGSEVTSHEIVNIDKLNPTITEFSENAVNKNSVTLNVGALDNESGINYYEIYQDNVKIGEKHFECYNETTFDEYEICRKDLPSERVNTYTVTGLTQSTTYTFRVKAYDKAGNSVLSEEIEVTTTTPQIVVRLIGYNNELFEDTIDPDTGDVIVPKEDKYINFESLEEAFDYEDIYDCKNVQCTFQMVLSTNESVEVLEGQNLTLDLNGKVVSGVNSEYTIKNNGEFTLIESTPESSEPGKLINTQGVALLNKTGASLTLGQGYADREVLSSIVSVTRPYIYGETVGVKNEKNGNFSFFDGRIVAPSTSIPGQGAVNGEVTAAEYSYTTVSNTEEIDGRNYQIVTLSKIIDPEARVNKGVYYNLLTSAMNNVNEGTSSSTSESGDLMNDLKPAGNFYFEKDENTGKWVSNNSGVDWFDVAKSKLIIDLRNETNNKILNINYIVDVLSGNESDLDRSYGYTDIYTGENKSAHPVTIKVNEYDNRTEELGDSINPYYKDHSDYNFELRGGEVYILNIEYLRPGTYLGEMTINSITLSDVLTDTSKVGTQEDISVLSYGFYYDENTQTVRSSNQYNNGDSVALGYIDIDLTDASYGTGEYKLIVNASMESYYYNATADGTIAVQDTETGSSTYLFTYRTNSYQDIQREGSTSIYEGFTSYGPDNATATLTGGKKYRLAMSYYKHDYSPETFPSREEFIAAGCSDQLIINSIDVVKVGESTKINIDDASIVQDDFVNDLLDNSNGTFILASDNKSITTNNVEAGQVSESHTTIDLRNDPNGLILLFGFDSIKGSNNSQIYLNCDAYGTSTSNYFRVSQKDVVDGVEVSTPVATGGSIKIDPSDDTYYYVFVLPGGYEYDFSLNVTAPTTYYDVFPNIKIKGMFTERLDEFEGNYFNGFYPDTNKIIISNNAYHVKDEVWEDSFIKIDLSTKDKNQILTFNGSYYNAYYSRYYVYLSNNNRALSYNDLFNNRSKEVAYIGSRGYGNKTGSSISSTISNNDIVLEKGNVYYLHFATKTYEKSGLDSNISSYGNYSIRLNSITLSPVEESALSVGGVNVFTGTVDVAGKPESKMVISKRRSSEPVINNDDTIYNFEYNETTGMYDALNTQVGTVAAKVFKIDLTETQSPKTYYFDTIGGYNNSYTISETEEITPFDLNLYRNNSTLPNYLKIDESGSFLLEPGKIYYVQVLTYKQSADTTPFSVRIAEIEGENTTTDYNKPKEVKEFNEKVDTVQLLKDVTTSQPIEIDYAEEVELDLNGFDLTTSNQDYVINNKGNLTIYDSKYDESAIQYEHDLAEYQEYAGLCDGCEPSAEYILDHAIEKEFDYSGSEQTFTAIYEGDYKLEVWGAQGGDAYYSTTYDFKGGYGGYSTGTIHLNAGDKLYVNVGGAGADTCGYNASCPGGYNGGGSGYTTTSSSNKVGSGGGATHIAKVSGTLNNLETNKGTLSQDETYYISDDIVIVAGGGGGAIYNSSYTSRYHGGSAGGKQGSIPSGTTNRTKHITGSGGSQTLGGTSFINYNSSYGDMDPAITDGSFGLGGSHSSTNNMYAAGGGGGFYGGAIGYLSGGTGGSGYIANSSLTNKTMVMYETNTSFASTDTETKTELTQNISESPKENYAKIGNGYAKISLVSSEEADAARENLPKTYDVKEEPDDSFKENISEMKGNSGKKGIIYNETGSELTLKTANLNVDSTYGVYNKGNITIDGEPTITLITANSVGIENIDDADIENNGKLNIVLNTSSCSSTKEYNTAGISYLRGNHDISNVNITGKNGTGIFVAEGTKVDIHSSNINLTDSCSTFTLGNPKDTTNTSEYNKTYSYSEKMASYYVNRYYYYYNRMDGSIFNKGDISVDNGTNLVGVFNNFGKAKLYNGVGFNDIYQTDQYKFALYLNSSRNILTVHADNPELTIYNTVANVNKIVNKGGTLNIIEEEGKTSTITSSSDPAIINLDKMNTIGGDISSLYNAGTLTSTNTDFNKLNNIHSYDGHTLTNSGYNNYNNIVDPKFVDKAGIANISGGNIINSILVNENEMTIDGTIVPNGIINRGNLVVKGNSIVTGTNKTAIFNKPFELKEYNSSGTILGYGYPETSVTLGENDSEVTAIPTINTTNNNYSITGDCYAKGTVPISGFKFTLLNSNYLSHTPTGESEDITTYPNNYSNLCKMNYYDGTITNTKLTDITDVVDLPIKSIASGYDVLYDNSNSVGKVTLDTIDSSSRANVIDVDGTPYKSLETAIANANNNSIISITGNYDSANRVTIPSDKNLTININTGANLNSYSKDALINNTGTLSITGDGTNNVIGAAAYQNNGNMVINGTNSTNNVDYYYKQSSIVLNNSSLTIDNTNTNNLDIITTNDDIENRNELVINDGVFNSGTIFGKNANVIVNGGYFDTTQSSNYKELVPSISGSDVVMTTVNTKAMFNVEGSNVTFNAFDEDSDSRYSSITLEQNLGTFSNGSTLSLNNSVMGGKSSKSAIYTNITNGSNLNVNGGTYNNMYFFLKDNANTYNQTSGTVNGELLVNGNSNAVTITGGKLLSTYDTAIFLLDSSNTTVTVGTKGDLIPGTEDLNVSKTDPEIKGSTFGVAAAGTTTGGNNLYFYDGIFKASSNPIDIHVEEIETGYDVVFKRNKTPKEKYLDILPTIYNYTTDTFYYDVQQSFNEANEDDELIWLRDYTNFADSPSLVVGQGQKFTLYLSYIDDGNDHYSPYSGTETVPSGSEVMAPIIYINNEDIKDPNTGEVITEVPFIINNGELTVIAGAKGESANTGTYAIDTNFETLSGTEIFTNNGTLNLNKVTAINIKNQGTMFKNIGTMEIYQGHFETLQANIIDNYGTLDFVGDDNDTSSCYNTSQIKVLYDDELGTALDTIIKSGGDVHQLIHESIINNANAVMNIKYLYFNGDYSYTAILNNGTMTIKNSGIELYRDSNYPSTLSIDKAIINNGTMITTELNTFSTKGILNNGILNYGGGYINAVFDTGIVNTNDLTFSGNLQGSYRGIEDTGTQANIMNYISTAGEAYHGTGPGTASFSGSFYTNGTRYSSYSVNYTINTACNNGTAQTASVNGTITNPWTYNINNGTIYVGNGKTLDLTRGAYIGFQGLTSLAHFCGYYNDPTSGNQVYYCQQPYNHKGEGGKNYTVAAIELENANMIMSSGTISGNSTNEQIRGLYAKNSTITFKGGSITSAYIENSSENVIFGEKDGAINSANDGFNASISKLGCDEDYKGISVYNGSYITLDRNNLCHLYDKEDNYTFAGYGTSQSYSPHFLSNSLTAAVNITKSQPYPSIENAISDASPGDTIMFNAHLTYPRDDYDVEINKDITIDLNGYTEDLNLNVTAGTTTITDLQYAADNTKDRGRLLKVTNSSGTLNITEGIFNEISDASSTNITGGRVDIVNSTGTLNITGGEVERTTSSGILSITGGTFPNVTKVALPNVRNTGVASITGVTIPDVENLDSGTLTLTGTRLTNLYNNYFGIVNLSGDDNVITSFTNNSNSSMTLSSGTVNTLNNVSNNGGILTIDGLNVTSKLYNNSYDGMIINSGTINSFVNSANATINGGTISSITNTDYKTDTITINNGTIGSITNSGTINILDGTIRYINNQAGGTLTIGNKEGTVSVTNPKVYNPTGEYAIVNSGTFNYYDGIFTAKNSLVISGTVTDTETDYGVYTAPDYDEESQLTGTYSMILKPASETDTKIACVNGICYNTLQEAMAASVQNCDETNICPMVVIGDQFFFSVELDEDLVLDPQYSLTINLNQHNLNKNGHSISENITITNGTIDGNNLQSSLAKFLSNVLGLNDNSKNIIITKMEDGNALDTTRTYKLYRLENGSYLPIKVDSDGAGKYSLGKETTDMKSIKGRIYINNVDTGEYMLKDNLDNELEFTIYEDGSLSPNIRENIETDYGHMSASAIATLIISIQTGIVRIRYILIGTIAVILILLGLLLYNRNKLTNKKETI